MNKADGGNMRPISIVIPIPNIKGCIPSSTPNMVSENITMFHRKYRSSKQTCSICQLTLLVYQNALFLFDPLHWKSSPTVASQEVVVYQLRTTPCLWSHYPAHRVAPPNLSWVETWRRHQREKKHMAGFAMNGNLAKLRSPTTKGVKLLVSYISQLSSHELTSEF